MISAPNSAQLPAHISALLQRQQLNADGLPADSAGVPWQGRNLQDPGNPLHRYDGDDGRIAQKLLAQSQAHLVGDCSEAEFVNALPGTRLFVPVIATTADEQISAEGFTQDKQADISLVCLESTDGRRTLPVFSAVTALTSWSAEARPVAASAEKIMLAALAEQAEWVVLDPQQDFSYIIRRPAVESIAQGRTWLPSYADHELAQSLAEIAELCPGVAQLQLSPHPGIQSQTLKGQRVLGGGSGPELHIGVVCEAWADAGQQRFAVASVKAALADHHMLRRRADSVIVSVL